MYTATGYIIAEPSGPDLASWQWLVDVSEDVGQQPICPVSGVSVQDSIQLCHTKSLPTGHNIHQCYVAARCYTVATTGYGASLRCRKAYFTTVVRTPLPWDSGRS